jgi:large subunit ribosomal protein L9
MKLILTQEVTGLGTPGDVVEVKDGYGRNYLLPRGLATPWTKGGEKQVASIRRARESREIKSVEDARRVKSSLEAKTVTLRVRAGTNGRLFGSVTPADVADAVIAVGGPQLDRRKVEVRQAIKSTGEYTVSVRLHPEVEATVKLHVVSVA